MAETAVSFVLEQFISLLAAEARLISKLPSDLVAINKQLKSINVFLKDAERRAEEDDVIKEWVRQVRDIAYQIEDVNDEYLILHHRPDNQLYHRFNVLHKLNQYVARMMLSHRLSPRIKGIQFEIQELSNRRSLFTLDRSPSSVYGPQVVNVAQDLRAGFHYVDESELVGIEEPKRELIRMLDLEHRDFQQCKVISVVGMGGLGKTTLVRKVYEDVSVRKHFPFRAWITHSRRDRNISIIRSMIKQLHKAARDSISPEIDSLDEELLIDELRNYLQEKRFLVVFDDVWNIETYFKDLLPTCNNKGSKILLTTRDEHVALAWKHSSYDHLYKLQPLSSEKAWNLFCRKAFQDPEATCPSELEILSQELVRKCEGLPLAIVTIGGLLSTKGNNVQEWQNLCDNIGPELANNCHLARIQKILLLSYYDLPHHLKPCFLYMGIFPSDRAIEFQRLIRLWMAEGFILNTPGKTLEMVAIEYLMELIRRSLVLVTWRDVTSRPRHFRVHDLLREIICLKSDDLCFFRVQNNENFIMDTQSRRLAVYQNKEGTSTGMIAEATPKNLRVRSLFLFVGREAITNIMTEPFLKSVRLLKVLDLQNAPLSQIPEAIGALFHLKLLSLKGTKIAKLPRSFGKLLNLLFLDVKSTPLQEIPLEISRMRKLRQLLSYSYHWDDTFSFYLRKVTAAKVPIAVCKNCPELQTLGWVDVSHSDSFIHELGNLKQLKRLGVAQLAREDGKNLCNTLKNLQWLEQLMIAARNKDELLDIDYISSPPRLYRLLLMGRLNWIPQWISALENIVKLVLCHSKLKDDPLEALGALPCLVKLILCDAYDGEQLFVGATRFQKLKVLRLYNFYNLKSIEIVHGALPVLKELELGPSPFMEKVPICFKHLENLTLLRFHDMPKRFSESMSPNKGECYEIIEHVPNVYINYKAGAGHWVTYSLRDPQDKEMVAYKTGANYHSIKRGTAWTPIN